VGVVYLTSAKGAPGVTTTALALTHSWRRPVMLVEADPAGSSILAGFLRGSMDHTHGLASVSLAQRQGVDIATALLEQSMLLAPDLLFIHGIADPAQAPTLAPVWAPMAEAFRQLDHAGIDVVVDAGRAGSPHAPAPLLPVSDLVGIVTRTSLPDIYATSRLAPALATQLSRVGGDRALNVVTVGPGRPYTDREIQSNVGLPVLPGIAWDPDAAEVFSVGAENRKGRSRLMQSAAALVEVIAGRIEQRRLELSPGAPGLGAPGPGLDVRPPPGARAETLRATTAGWGGELA